MYVSLQIGIPMASAIDPRKYMYLGLQRYDFQFSVLHHICL